MLEEGLRDGARVALHLTGATAKLFCAGRYALDPRIAVSLAPDAEPPSAICAREGARVPVREFARQREWDVLVASASASVAGTQAAAASLCVARSTKKLSFLVQDMYGTSHRTLREVLRTCPERAGTFITFVGNDLTGRLIGEQVRGDPPRTPMTPGAPPPSGQRPVRGGRADRRELAPAPRVRRSRGSPGRWR